MDRPTDNPIDVPKFPYFFLVKKCLINFPNNAIRIIKAPIREIGTTRKAPIFKIRSNTGITINSINPITIRALNPVIKSLINSKYGFFFL